MVKWRKVGSSWVHFQRSTRWAVYYSPDCGWKVEKDFVILAQLGSEEAALDYAETQIIRNDRFGMVD